VPRTCPFAIATATAPNAIAGHHGITPVRFKPAPKAQPTPSGGGAAGACR
jgi:hypothetical protein